MAALSQSSTHQDQTAENLQKSEIQNKTEEEKILCPHCLRTATNGIKCLGKCVADSDY